MNPREPKPPRILRASIILAIAAAVAFVLAGKYLEAVALVCAAHAAFCITAAIPNHGLTGPLVKRFHTAGRDVWLTIDDGPHPESTPRILEILRAHGAKATFFVIGQRAQRYPELLQAIVREGHSLGNHTYRHASASFWTAGPWRIAREIDNTTEAIIGAGLPAPRFFRPPVGMANLFVAPALRSRHMLRIGWTVRGFDTRSQDIPSMVEKMTSRCEPGDIILFHELGPAAGIHSLDTLLTRLAEKACTCAIPGLEALTCAPQPIDLPG